MNSMWEIWKKHKKHKKQLSNLWTVLNTWFVMPKSELIRMQRAKKSCFPILLCSLKAWSWWFYGLFLNSVTYYATSSTHWVCHLGMRCGTWSIPTKLWIVPIASVLTMNVRWCSCRASTMLCVLGSTQLPIEYGLCVNSVPKWIVKTTQWDPSSSARSY